jgi:hypothetical protein
MINTRLTILNAIPRAPSNNRFPWATTHTSQWPTPTCSTQAHTSIKGSTTIHMRCSSNSRHLCQQPLLRKLRLAQLIKSPRRPFSRHSPLSQRTRNSNRQLQIKSDSLKRKASPMAKEISSKSGAPKRLRSNQPNQQPRAPTLSLSQHSEMKRTQLTSKQSP